MSLRSNFLWLTVLFSPDTAEGRLPLSQVERMLQKGDLIVELDETAQKEREAKEQQEAQEQAERENQQKEARARRAKEKERKKFTAGMLTFLASSGKKAGSRPGTAGSVAPAKEAQGPMQLSSAHLLSDCIHKGRVSLEVRIALLGVWLLGRRRRAGQGMVRTLQGWEAPAQGRGRVRCRFWSRAAVRYWHASDLCPIDRPLTQNGTRARMPFTHAHIPGIPPTGQQLLPLNCTNSQGHQHRAAALHMPHTRQRVQRARRLSGLTVACPPSRSVRRRPRPV